MASAPLLAVLDRLGRLLTEALAVELARQGRRASGKLIAGLKWMIIDQGDIVTLVVLSEEDYAFPVDGGPRVRRKVFRNARGQQQVLGKEGMESLMQWVRDKAIAQGDREVKNIAWAINVQMAKRGGRWKSEGQNFIQMAIDTTQLEVDMLLDNAAEQDANIAVDRVLQKAKLT